ncbi:MAG TPA: Ig-like domain-containing protein [Gemmatimonadaceae bacterium]|nr:Ig-like domain-containing protein [Gemmatimonadaceae bacterium]
MGTFRSVLLTVAAVLMAACSDSSLPVDDGSNGGEPIIISRDDVTLDVGDTLRVLARVNAADGTEVTAAPLAWSSSDTRVVVVEDGLIIPVGPGDATVTVAHGESQVGIAVHARGAATLAEVVITPSELALQVGDSAQLEALLRFSNGAEVPSRRGLTWASSDEAVLQVIQGLVHARAAGSAEVTAQAGDQVGRLPVRVDSPAPGDTTTPAPGDTVPAPTPVPGGEQLYGLHMDLTWNDGASWRAAAVGRAQAVGSRVSRNSFLWHRIEPVRGQKNWSTPDAVVREVRAAGMEPVFAIYGSPLWANGQASSVSDAYLYVPQDGAAFSRWVAEYAAFVREAVTRYRGQVTKWELWNEQNEHYFWKPAPNLDRYAEWYRAVYAAAKAADPSAQIAMGGMAGVAYSGAQDIAGRTFLAGLYQRGIYPDIVNIHPYPIQNQAPDVTIQFENNFTDIATIKAVMDQHGQGNKPMWVTEWGWNLGAVSEAQQATYVQRSLEMLASRYPYVTLATYFQDMDVGGYRYGLYRGDGSARPAATSFKNFMNGR